MRKSEQHQVAKRNFRKTLKIFFSLLSLFFALYILRSQELSFASPIASNVLPSSYSNESVNFPTLSIQNLEVPAKELSVLTKQLIINKSTAKNYAYHWLKRKQELIGEIQACFYLPVRDKNEHQFAHLFIFTNLPNCNGFISLIDIWFQQVKQIDQNLSEANRFRKLTKLSAKHFFTLSISSYSFRHPIYDGIKGLPLWFLHIENKPHDEDGSPHIPIALYPSNIEKTIGDVLAYESSKQILFFSQHQARLVTKTELSFVFEATHQFNRWRQHQLRKHGDNTEAILWDYQKHWLPYLTL